MCMLTMLMCTSTSFLVKIMEKKDKWKKRNLGTIDLDTGEIIEGVAVYTPGRVKWPKDKGFFMGIQDAFIALAKDKEIRGNTRSVLDYLMGKLGFENWISIQQKEIVENLGLHKAIVSKSIKLLVQKKIILSGPKIGNRTTSYKLNESYGYKGKLENIAKNNVINFKKREELENKET